MKTKTDPNFLIEALLPTVVTHGAMSCRQLFVLLVLKAEDKGAPIDFKVLVERMKVTKPSVTRALDALEYTGMIWRAKDEDDLRKSLVTLTVKGHEFIEEVLA